MIKQDYDFYIMNPLHTEIGFFVEFPADADEVLDRFKRELGYDGDWIIADYNLPFEINEGQNIHKLCEFMDEFDSLNVWEQGQVCAYISNNLSCELNDALEGREQYSHLCEWESDAVSSYFHDHWLDLNYNLVNAIETTEYGSWGLLDAEYIFRADGVSTIKTRNHGIYYYTG